MCVYIRIFGNCSFLFHFDYILVLMIWVLYYSVGLLSYSFFDYSTAIHDRII